MRANAIYLNTDQMWEVATYCIENKGLVLDENGLVVKFRVGKSELVKEISEKLFKITSQSLTKSIKYYETANRLTKRQPIIPVQESVQEDILKIEIAKLKETLSGQEAIIAGYNKQVSELRIELHTIKEHQAKIRKMLG